MKNSKVAIFGASSAGHHVLKELQKAYGDKVSIVGVLDNFATDSIDGVNVYKPENFFSEFGDVVEAVIITAGAQRTLKVMMDTLLKYNVRNIYRIKDTVGKNKLPIFKGEQIIGNRLQKIKFSEEKPTLPYFELPITDGCNLNCKGCLFGCNVESEQSNIPYEDIVKDVRRMSELFEDIPWIRVLGGEPLLHPDVVEILCEIRKIFPNADVDICTNGLKLPDMPDKFFRAIINNDISVHISGYPPTYKLYPKIQAKLDEYGIDAVTLEREEFFKFYTLEPVNDAQLSYENCITSACREVYRGHISNCSGVIAFDKMNQQFGTNYKVLEGNDYINIHDNISGWDIIHVLDKATNACKYCNTHKLEKFEWENAPRNPQISDYIIDN